MSDKYQNRYVAHQRRKKGQLIEVMKRRHSERVFSDKKVEPEKMELILEMAQLCPSSCDRKAIDIKIIDDRDDKQILSGLLVGGVGWIHRAPKILLLFGNRFAYKENLFYMPYLDAGCIIQQIYLTCTEMGLSCCYCNPNIRINHYFAFEKLFMSDPDLLFCGAMGFGYKA